MLRPYYPNLIEGLHVLHKNAIVFITAPVDAQFYSNFPLPREELIVVPLGQAVCSMMFREIDLILLDCGFEPNLGLSMVKDLKTRFSKVPILFVTGQSSEDIVTQAFRYGVRDYYVKPLPVMKVRDFMIELLTAKRTARSRSCIVPALADELPTNANLCQTGSLQPAVMRVVCYIESNFKEAISLEQMARMANMSKHHFVRLFRREVNMSPVRYLKFVRIQRAKHLLKRPDLKIFTIAMQVGFRDVSNFNKNFKEFEGCTPSRYQAGKD